MPVSEWVILCLWACVSGTEERFKCESPMIRQIPHCVRGYLCRRGQGEHQRQQYSLSPSVVQCFLTQSDNWRHSCWQQISTSLQHQASGGVGQRVGQQDMMSDESRAGQGQSSRGEKHDMASDDYEQGRVRDETALGRKDGNQMDSKQDLWRLQGRWEWGSEGGREVGARWGDKGRIWRAQVDSLRSQGPQERNHIYKAQTAVEIQNRWVSISVLKIDSFVWQTDYSQ